MKKFIEKVLKKRWGQLSFDGEIFRWKEAVMITQMKLVDEKSEPQLVEYVVEERWCFNK